MVHPAQLCLSDGEDPSVLAERHDVDLVADASRRVGNRAGSHPQREAAEAAGVGVGEDPLVAEGLEVRPQHLGAPRIGERGGQAARVGTFHELPAWPQEGGVHTQEGVGDGP